MDLVFGWRSALLLMGAWQGLALAIALNLVFRHSGYASNHCRTWLDGRDLVLQAALDLAQASD